MTHGARFISAALTVTLLSSLPAAAQDYAPRNECSTVDGAAEFRLKLVTAVVNRNEAMLLELAWPEILLDFGGGSGREILRERLTDPNYRLWEELDRLLPLGCARSTGDILVLPWYFGQELGTSDPFATFLTIGSDIAVHKTPDITSEILEWLSWEPVILEEAGGSHAEFIAVRTRAGTFGYVPKQQIRSEIDYRLVVEPTEEGYRITAFVAGD